MTRTTTSTRLLRRDGGIDRRALLAAAAGLGASAFGLSGRRAAAQEGPFKLGWIRPTTGRLVSTFAPLYVGGLIAVDEINQSGGILGRKIERVEEDDEASPAKEPGVAKKVMDAGVNAIIGPVGSSQALSSLAFTTPNKVIQSTYANASELGDGSKFPYHFQCSFSTDLQAEVAVRHMTERLKLKKLGILQENTAFGEQATAKSVSVLKLLGLEPTSIQVYPLNAPDLNSYIGNLRRSGAEAVLAWTAIITNAAQAFNAMNSLKWHPPIVGHNGIFIESIFNLVPPEALANVYATYYRSLTWTETESPGPAQQAFAKKLPNYPEAKGSEVNVAASPFYDFLHLLKATIESEKAFDPTKIKTALDNTEGFQGLLGTYNFTPSNHTGISADDVVLASLASGKDPRAQLIFRARAT